MRKKTQDEFVKDLSKVTDEIIVIGDYINSKEKIKVQCRKCGNIWLAAPSNLLNGNKCPKCYGTPKKTNEQFVKELKEKNPDVIPLEKYIDAKTKIKLQCNICGHIWYNNPNLILSGRRCPKCFGTPRKTNEQFQKQFYMMNDNIILESDYINHTQKIRLRCKKCNYQWMARPNDLIRRDGKKTGCPRCAGNMLKTHEQFINQMSKISNKIKVLETYQNNRKKILVKCLICGNEWKAVPHALLMGQGCPQCASGFQTSFFEQCILKLLIRIYGKDNVISRDKSIIGKEIDIYIPSIKKAIEPGSWFWHKDKIKNDELKYKLCKEKGVDLLTIYDDVDKNIKSIKFKGNLLLIHEDLGIKKKSDALKLYLSKILQFVGQEKYIIDEKMLEEIKSEADISTKKKNTEDFIVELETINPNIIVLGEYINSKNKIRVKCKKCEHIWKAIPSNLLRNHGCPKCAKIYKKTTSEFKKELKIINDSIDVIGEYNGAREKIKVKCKVCNFIWEPATGNLLAGHGCPKKHYKHNK